MPCKIVVFTGNLAYSVRAGILAIDRALPGTSWLVIVHAPRKSAAKLLGNQWRNLRRNGMLWIPYQLREVRDRWLRRDPAPLAEDAPGYEATLDALCAQGNVLVKAVTDLHADATLALIRDFAPDLGLALAAPILRAPLFSIPRLGTLNLHKGKVPDFRGMPPAFWELWHRQKRVGCTVHQVDSKLDTGDIICETTVDCERYSTVRGLQLCLDEVGVALMRQAAIDVLEGRATPRPQPAVGNTYRKPTLAQIAALSRRLNGKVAAGEGAKHALKEAFYKVAILIWYAVMRWFSKPRATVLLYHRVSDDCRDNLTVGIEQFDRQMALLRRSSQVISIEQLAAMKVVPRSHQPIVCVTFDDGYLDNYANAAPILRRHGIPAAFFVATAIVGTDKAFPHDVRRGASRPPTMTWDHLREMRDHRFTIGSHSANHIDCAAESESVVQGELVQSMDDLRRELGVRDLIFAYPYGARQNMTPERLELVKRAGYVACLSAYGGTNVGAVDRFNVLRGGIHWGFSDRAFWFRCLGLR